jgi:hypothetical protein
MLAAALLAQHQRTPAKVDALALCKATRDGIA